MRVIYYFIKSLFQISNDARASLSLMTTSRLPINVIDTKDVDQFYHEALEKNQLGVSDPFHDILMERFNL